MTVLVLGVAVVALMAFSAYVVMLLSGALGHIFGASWLWLGYWQAVVVAIALSVLGSFFRGNS